MAVLKHSKKIAKISMLLIIRQLWGLLCNLYLLAYQPFLTIRTIRGTKDKSQFLLIGLTALSPGIAYVAARAVLDLLWFGRWVPSVGVVFGVTALLEIVILGYLGYWTMEVIRKNHKGQFKEE